MESDEAAASRSQTLFGGLGSSSGAFGSQSGEFRAFFGGPSTSGGLFGSPRTSDVVPIPKFGSTDKNEAPRIGWAARDGPFGNVATKTPSQANADDDRLQKAMSDEAASEYSGISQPQDIRDGVEHAQHATTPQAGDPSSGDSPSATEINAVLGQLQSAEQAELLDAIDELRKENIQTEISLPQVIVCGDQSSGKSSVLEAIARLQFPSGIGKTTCFATELVLRNSPTQAVRVSIEPSADRKPGERAHLKSFERAADSIEQFLHLHTAASKFLSDHEPQRAFWYDRLRVEVSGPDQPHLTLVDLPGLIHARSGKQSSEDIQKITGLVKSYVSSPRTIVLAVVNARYDLSLQAIVELINSEEHPKARTLGVITNPDGAQGDDGRRTTVDLAQNKSTQLGLGWHVVKNISHEEPDRTAATRDKSERDFLRDGVWSQLGREDCGIQALRQKLSKILLEAIRMELPSLLTEMRRHLNICNSLLKQLGPGRKSTAAYSLYLTSIASRLQALIKSAFDGDYQSSEDASFFETNKAYRLRDRVSKLSDDFAQRIRKSRQFHLWGEVAYDFPARRIGCRDLSAVGTLSFLPPYRPIQHTPITGRAALEHHPLNVKLLDYCRELTTFMRDTRGRDLPGMLSGNTITVIFRQQSVHWEPLSAVYLNACLDLVRNFSSAAVRFVAGRYTGQALWKEYGTPMFEDKSSRLSAKLKELLWPYKKCHPISYHRTFAPRTQNEQDDRPTRIDSPENKTITSRFADLAATSDWESHLIPAAEALDRANVYYEVSLDTFIENVAVLAIERCLLNDLSELITPAKVLKLGPDELSALGHEPQEAMEARLKAENQARALEDAIKICSRHSESLVIDSSI